jgi:superfamily II DNA or RNA helicase
LLDQWRERLETFLDLKAAAIGRIGGGKHRPTGGIDIAVIQSLARKTDVSALLENYGQIVVDECHHLSAVSFEALLRSAKARYVLGLTATPTRRDGHHPIIFMQCGPIRHQPGRVEAHAFRQEVRPRFLDTHVELPEGAGIQELFKRLVHEPARNRHLLDDIRAAYGEGRKVIVLSSRTDHLSLLETELAGTVEHLFVLQGRSSKPQRAAVLQALEDLDPTAPRVLLASQSLVGEGFAHPPLDTLVLAMPVSWVGSLKQYAGRLHRTHAHKSDVRIYDYVELAHAPLANMWEKRRRGYAAMGYEVIL